MTIALTFMGVIVYQTATLPPEQLEKLNKIQNVSIGADDYKLRYSRLVAAAGLTQKAKDHDDCGRQAQFYGCNRHPGEPILPFGSEPRSCRQRFVPCCSVRILHERLDKHEQLMSGIEDIGANDDGWPTQYNVLTYTDIVPKTIESIDAVRNNIVKTLKSLFKSVEGKDLDYDEPCYIRVVIQGFKDDRIHASAIYWGPYVSSERLKQSLKSLGTGRCEVTCRRRDNAHIREAFEEVLKIIIPRTPEEQAEMEIMCDGTRLLTSYKQGMEELFPCMDTQGNNSVIPGHEDGSDCSDHDSCYVSQLPNCPICHQRANLISELHPVGTLAMDIAKGEWIPLGPLRSP